MVRGFSDLSHGSALLLVELSELLLLLPFMSNLLLLKLVGDLLEPLIHKLVNRGELPLVTSSRLIGPTTGVIVSTRHLHLLQDVTIRAGRNSSAPRRLARAHLLDHGLRGAHRSLHLRLHLHLLLALLLLDLLLDHSFFFLLDRQRFLV